MISSFIKSSSSIREAFTPYEKLLDLRVSFIHLEQLIGIQVWILVIKADHNTNVQKIRVHVVSKGATIHIRRKWPVHSMLNSACLEVWITLRNSPYLFQTDAIVLETCAIFV